MGSMTAIFLAWLIALILAALAQASFSQHPGNPGLAYTFFLVLEAGVRCVALAACGITCYLRSPHILAPGICLAVLIFVSLYTAGRQKHRRAAIMTGHGVLAAEIDPGTGQKEESDQSSLNIYLDETRIAAFMPVRTEYDDEVMGMVWEGMDDNCQPQTFFWPGQAGNGAQDRNPASTIDKQEENETDVG